MSSSVWVSQHLHQKSKAFSRIINNSKRFLSISFIRYHTSSLICQDREKKVSKFEQSGLTEEELLAKQEELFAASRARFQSGQQWRRWIMLSLFLHIQYVCKPNLLYFHDVCAMHQVFWKVDLHSTLQSVYGSWQVNLPVRWWKTPRRSHTRQLTKRRKFNEFLLPITEGQPWYISPEMNIPAARPPKKLFPAPVSMSALDIMYRMYSERPTCHIDNFVVILRSPICLNPHSFFHFTFHVWTKRAASDDYPARFMSSDADFQKLICRQFNWSLWRRKWEW